MNNKGIKPMRNGQAKTTFFLKYEKTKYRSESKALNTTVTLNEDQL